MYAVKGHTGVSWFDEDMSFYYDQLYLQKSISTPVGTVLTGYYKGVSGAVLAISGMTFTGNTINITDSEWHAFTVTGDKETGVVTISLMVSDGSVDEASPFVDIWLDDLVIA
jgi:hypothetical protein